MPHASPASARPLPCVVLGLIAALVAVELPPIAFAEQIASSNTPANSSSQSHGEAPEGLQPPAVSDKPESNAATDSAGGPPSSPNSNAESDKKKEEAEEKPSSEPDRWFLMRELDGTCPGCFLQENRIEISGWTEASLTVSSAHSSNLPMGFNYLANDFALQQNWLRIDRPVVTKDTTEASYGFRSDTILPGTDYRFTAARGLFSDQLTADNGQPNTYGFDPVQFYGEAYFPTIAKGLDVKVGRIFCQYGAETIDAIPNSLASHSYTFIYDPFTHTGVMGTLQMTDEWSIQLGAMAGPDVFIDPASSPYGMFTLKWAPPEGSDTVLVAGVLGSGRFDVAENFNNPNMVDLVYTHAFNKSLNYTLDALFGYQTNVPGIGTATWFSFVNYLTYKFSSKVSMTGRLEFFDDIDGNRTGFEGLYTTATVGVNVQARKSLILRPEIRYDYNTESRPFEGRHDLLTAAVDVILRW